MARLAVCSQSWGEIYSWTCPGCRCTHRVHVRDDGKGPSWTFDGNLDRPTFSPSILVREYVGEDVSSVCHSFVRVGRIVFLSDCTHHLAGQTVDMPEQDS